MLALKQGQGRWEELEPLSPEAVSKHGAGGERQLLVPRTTPTPGRPSLKRAPKDFSVFVKGNPLLKFIRLCKGVGIV